jgi:hypothetical protein
MCGIKLVKMATHFLIFPSPFLEVEAVKKSECNMDKGFMIELNKVELWFVLYFFSVSMVLMVGFQLISFDV